MIRKDYSYKFIVLAIIFMAICFRVLYIQHGLPYVYDPNGIRWVNTAAWMGGTGNLNTHSISGALTHGFIYYILLAEFALCFVTMQLFGIVGSLREFSHLFITDPSVFHILGRLTTVAASLGGLFLLYQISDKIFGRRVAILALLFQSVNILDIEACHGISVDILMSLFVLWAMKYLIDLSYSFNNRGDYFLFGLFAGLAVITKVMGAILIFPLILCILQSIRKKQFRARHIFYVAAGGVLGANIADPYIFIDFGTWIREYSKLIFFHAATGWKGAEHNRPLYYLKYLYHMLGPAASVLCIYGIIRMAAGRSIQKLLFLTLFFSSFVILLLSRSIFHRYLFPVVYMISIFVGLGFAELCRRFRLRSSIAAVLLLTVLAFPLKNAVGRLYVYSLDHTQIEAKKWVEENIPFDTKILCLDYAVQLDPSPKSLEDMYAKAKSRGMAKQDYYSLMLEVIDRGYDISLVHGEVSASEPQRQKEYESVQKHEYLTGGLEDIRQKGYKYIILNESTISMYMSEYARNSFPDYYKFFQDVRTRCVLEKYISHKYPFRRTGGDIWIYRIPEAENPV